MTGSTSSITPLESARNARASAADTQPRAHPLPPGQSRAEPYWGGPSIPPFASAAYEQLHSDEGRLFGPRAQTRRFSRILLMAAIFAVGAIVGLAAAWWLNPAFLGHHLATINNAPSITLTPERKKPGLDVRPEAVRGISASELPYDGAPPPSEATPAGAARNALPPGSMSSGSARTAPEQTVDDGAPPPREATPAGAARNELSPGSMSSGSAGTAPEQTVDSGAAAQEAAPSPQDGKKEASSEPVAAKPEPAKPLEKANASSKSPEPKAAKLTPKRRPIPKVVKNREIDRLRQQAEEELKKKTEAGRRINEARAPAGARVGRQSSPVMASAGPQAVRSKLARCDRAANLFRREQCKWRICGGMWGKNGCPSYATASNTY